MLLTVTILVAVLSLGQGVVIQTKLGSLKGWESTSRDGKLYNAFSSVPYAKPPIGNLRFKNPEPIGPWAEEKDATKDLPSCYQSTKLFPINPLDPPMIGSEDCLYLGIYSPKDAKNLPVMAYIHGGGFRMGHPGPREMADYFMDEGVVLVTMTYRLGSLGFLSLEDETIPGNFGLKDQALAIKWIKENIESFGGDPTSITLFGESAGGASTHYHMYSPLSKDLIKGVISQSGVINKIWAFSNPGENKKKSKQIAAEVGCSTDCPKKMLECLQNTDAEKIVESEFQFMYWDIDDIVPLRPVVEVDSPGAFLIADPWTMRPTTPFLTGFATGEKLLRSLRLKFGPKTVVQDLVDRVDELTAKQLQLDPSLESTKQIVEKVKAHYYVDKDLNAMIEQFSDFFAHSGFIFPSIKAVQKHKGKSYMYYLEYRGEGTIFDMIAKTDTTIPAHADEILYLFNQKKRFHLKGTEEDTKVSKTLVKLWANFAKHQNPTPPGSEFEWPEYNKKTRKYLKIGKEGFVVSDKSWPEMYTFWNNLHKIKLPKQEL